MFEFENEKYPNEFLDELIPCQEHLYKVQEKEIYINLNSINKERFKFPNPKQEKSPAYVDNRSEKQIVSDIIRILMCQLNSEETALWSSIVNRDLKIPLTIDSELRMPKIYLDKLVKGMKLSHKEKQRMTSEIDNLPKTFQRPISPSSPLRQPEEINAGIPGTANENIPDLQPGFAQDFALHTVSGLPNVKVPNFPLQKAQTYDLAKKGQSVQQENEEHICTDISMGQGFEITGMNTCSEKVNSGTRDQGYVSKNHCIHSSSNNICVHCKDRPSMDEYYINHPKLQHTLVLLEKCRIKTGHTVAIILNKNPLICLKLLSILKEMYNIKRFYSFIKRIREDSTYRMNLRLCKRLSQFCHIRDIWPKCWLFRVNKNISVKDLGKGVSLFVKFGNSSQNHQAIIDTGSDFSILPYMYLKQLGIHGNRLNKTIVYNVTSATSTEKNAVLGSISLRLQLQNEDDSFQTMNHTFLILREQISLNRILLGDTFCKSQDVLIKYSKNDETKATVNGQIIKLLSDPPPQTPLLPPLILLLSQNLKPKVLM